MTEPQKQVGRNENAARAANELVSVEGEQAKLIGGAALAVLCECGDSSCHEPLTMSVDQYEHIRSEPAQFAVLRGHEILDCEQVIATFDNYLIVEKFGDAGLIAEAADPRHHLKVCRVVVIDDIPAVRDLLKLLVMLEPSCTVVGEAANGVEAIDVVKATQPEVAVLDLDMPVMDGWHALPILRQVSPTTSLIVFSGSIGDARVEKRLINMGADRVVRKGDPTGILEAVRTVALSGRDRQFSETATD